ncbi:MAG: DUF2085 domain-containing protein, partial [Anaerolineae bacterium]
FNAVLLAIIVPMFLAPALMHAGYEGAGRFLYTLYAPTCHQLPERSFFLFGEKLVYSWDELAAAGMDPAGSPFQRRQFLGAPQIGYKMLVCQRDVTIYLGLVLFGALYALGPRRWLKPLPLWGLALFLLPLAVDGLTQVTGWRESTPALRVLTGLPTSAGTIWFVYPYIEAAMLDLRRELVRKLKIETPPTRS